MSVLSPPAPTAFRSQWPYRVSCSPISEKNEYISIVKVPYEAQRARGGGKGRGCARFMGGLDYRVDSVDWSALLSMDNAAHGSENTREI